MRVPLIVAARPSLETVFPSTRLRPGKWVFTHNCADSLLVIRAPLVGDVDPSHQLILEEESFVSVVFTSVGKESSIMVYACHSP